MVVIGQAGAQRSVRISYDRTRGRRGYPEFSGTYAAMCGIAATLAATVEWDLQPVDGGLYVLSIREPDVTDGTAADASAPVWELHANAVQRDIYEHPYARAIAQEYIADIRAYFEQDAPFPFWMEEGWSPPAPAEAVTLFNLLNRGTRHFESDQFVLRKTQVVPWGSTIEIVYAMTGLTFTNAQMTGAGWAIGIPSDLVFSINAIVPPLAGVTPSGYRWAWLKRAPQVQQLAGSKWQVVDEYWYDLWSTNLYANSPATRADAGF
jgi:hypothetical protein